MAVVHSLVGGYVRRSFTYVSSFSVKGISRIRSPETFLQRNFFSTSFIATKVRGVYKKNPGRISLFGKFNHERVEKILLEKDILRCIQSRGITSKEAKTQVTEKVKGLLRENLYTLPNMLTFSRIASSPLIGYLIIANHLEAALGLFVVSGVTDMLDGYIARNYNMQSIVGSILDPLADKVLMTVLIISMSWVDLIPAPLAYLILGRDGGLVLASFYYRYISLPPPKTMIRYWDFTIPSAEVHPTLISKANTFLQLGLVGSTLLAATLGVPVHPILTGLQYTVAATTIGSGLSYAFSKDAIRILSQPKKP